MRVLQLISWTAAPFASVPLIPATARAVTSVMTRIRVPNARACGVPTFLFAVALGFGGSAAYATRGILIDNNATELLGDATPGQKVSLPFSVNFGTGLQNQLIINLPSSNSSVGLFFSSNAAETLFAGLNVAGGPSPTSDTSVAFFNNDQSLLFPPLTPPTNPSIFTFGLTPVDSVDPPWLVNLAPNSIQYGPLYGSAGFSFTDLSGSGNAGDFGLLLTCTNLCNNIGFSLDGAVFNSKLTTLPKQYVSPCAPGSTSCDSDHSWYFVFRSAAAVPEPATWAMMLLGFGAVGAVGRGNRKRGLRVAT